MPRVLVFELWGLGDATLATTAIRRLLAEGCEVTMLCKANSAELLAVSYPDVHYEILDAPWTAFHGKYRFWRWPWRKLCHVIWKLRRRKFDLALGWRRDPRDHVLMWLVGARKRAGRPIRGSQIFLTHPTRAQPLPRHSVDCWRDVLDAAGISSQNAQPYLLPPPETPRSNLRPVFVIHSGAQQPVRRWPAPYWRELVHHLRELYAFHLLVIPDPDGYGSDLANVANEVLPNLTLAELSSTLANADLVFCNDSAPAHIAAAVDTPVIAFFGPQLPASFAPFGVNHLAISRDICPYRPCFDYCRFPEPKCLTELTVTDIWPEVKVHIDHLLETGVLPSRLRKARQTEPEP